MKKFKYLKLSNTKKLRFIDNYFKKKLYVVFLHGFMSDIEGKKPQSLLRFVKKKKLGFLALEYTGHGKSSGEFTKGNISTWTSDTKLVIKKIVKKNNFILIGSSMGSWIGLNQFKYFKKQIKGFIGIGSAPEFLTRLMWNKFSKKIKSELLIKGKTIIKSGDYEYPITYQLIKDGRKNMILNKKINTKWITYLSATSVYGNHNGEWVNEDSETKPTSTSGVKRLKAENQWLKFSSENNLPLQIFRLSGIYSVENNILKRLISGQAKIVKKENHFFSRIHVEDIANILFDSMKKFKSNEIYNISDDKPASQEEIVSYGTKLLKIKSPELLQLEALEDGMLKDFYKDSKKVDNQKVKKFFNYQFTYPTYKEGLDKIFNDIV